MPRKLSHFQLLLRQARSVGPLEVPLWQVPESLHQPHPLRSVQLPQPVEVLQRSVGLPHWERVYAQLVQVPGASVGPVAVPVMQRPVPVRHQPQAAAAEQEAQSL